MIRLLILEWPDTDPSQLYTGAAQLKCTLTPVSDGVLASGAEAAGEVM